MLINIRTQFRAFCTTVVTLMITAQMLAAQPVKPQSRMNDPLWAARYAAKAEEAQRTHPNLILLGDSLLGALQRPSTDPRENIVSVWRQYFAPYNAIDLGFAGDTTANLLWRIDNGELNRLTPRAAVVLIGANDVRTVRYSDPEGYAANVVYVVHELHLKLPATRILVLGLLPTQYQIPYAAANAILASTNWATSNAHFVQIGHVLLLPNGTPNAALYLDPLLRPGAFCIHPNAIGWERLAAALQPYLESAMKS